MRGRWHRCLIVLPVAVACGGGDPWGPTFIEFAVDGVEYRSADANVRLAEGVFRILEEDYVHLGRLELRVPMATMRPGTYSLTDPDGVASFRGLGTAPEYSTLHGGGGDLVIAAFNGCKYYEFPTGPPEYTCQAEGEFAFVALTEGGDSLQVTGGRFRVTY